MDWHGIYKAVYVLDFEFVANDGARQRPICLVYRELISGTENRVWIEEGAACPFPTGPDVLFVGFYASAEWGCFLSLGWEVPERCIDLCAEYRVQMTGNAVPWQSNLVFVANAFGISTMETAYKKAMRDLIIAGGPWSDSEQEVILEYCAEDVALTEQVFRHMWPLLSKSPLSFTQALFRGRYTCAVARIEFAGTPIDVDLLGRLRSNWAQIQLLLIAAVDVKFGVYVGTTFKQKRFEKWCCDAGIAWPRTDTGKLKTDTNTFRQIAKTNSDVALLHQLRVTIQQMRTLQLAVGADGQNRTLLSPFASKTGRNQPSTTKFIFGISAWLRALIKPGEGYGLAYVDFSSQEIAIAAALSGDGRLWKAYDSGDPYITFAIQAGLAPEGASKATHKDIRNRCKQIVLGVGYGMGAEAMAQAAGIHIVEARDLLARHRSTYRVFWKWAESNQMHAMMGGTLETPLGWRIQLRNNPDINARSLLNWPMQSTGADMMRLAACMLTEAGVEVCCPVHDAFLVKFPLEQEDKIVKLTKDIMIEASEIVMGAGFKCRVDADIVRYPDRYMDERGEEMFAQIMRLLEETAP